ncbi:response regulator transcription factor [Schaalia sp. 19OD2882]|uniref:response regulator transcription factor n=1 Tax=Schaalia sp. 19OD2882 TaxID=2794089 RepID=UPI001C1EC85F|nr:response regulator transcription factor [Schaalia sp. 19OD2882]QWW19553.1 response regulator transcription factor [Schaalia sp. 19OD2882]
MSNAPHIVVIDDHEIVGHGVAHAFHVQGVDAEVTWFPDLKSATLAKGDIAVLDLRLADSSTPTENIQSLMAQEIPVVIYTSADDPVLVREAISAGALSIVRKSTGSHEIVEAVQEAAEGRTRPGLDWAAALDADDDFVTSHLSALEAQVLARYASGEASDAVARALGISKNTVNTYIARIRDKYRQAGRTAESRVDLFRRAAEDGLVSYFD